MRHTRTWTDLRSIGARLGSMSLNTDVAHAIQRVIDERGLTLRKAAERVGRSHNWLGMKLRGQSTLTLDDLEEIGAGLGFDPEELVRSTRL